MLFDDPPIGFGPAAPGAPSDPPLRIVRLAGGPARYTDEGRGPPVVAVHGLPGSARDFRWLAPQLTVGARVIRAELPGFGGTPLETEPDPSPVGRARLVFALSRALGLDRPLLVGHSMGGVVACAAADLWPEAFRGLALIASPGLRPHAMLRRLPLRLFDRLLRSRLFGPRLAPLLRGLFALSGFRGYPDAELYRTIRCVAQTSIAEHAARVQRLRLPTLVCWCDDDPLIERAIAEELAAACPAGPRLRFAEGGHNPQKTRAAAIGRALVGWLGEL